MYNVGCTNPLYLVALVSKFCTATPNIRGSAAWLLLHVDLLAPRFLRWFLDFWKIFAPVMHSVSIQYFEFLCCLAFSARKFGHPRCSCHYQESLKHGIGAVFTLCTTRFNIQQFYVLPTRCIYVFFIDFGTNSDYFTIQH
jgi:hypothetical protein